MWIKYMTAHRCNVQRRHANVQCTKFTKKRTVFSDRFMAAQTNTHICVMPPSCTHRLALHSRSVCSLTDLFIYAWQAADWRDRENHVTWFLHFSKSWSNSYLWGDPRSILKRQKFCKMLAKDGGLDEQVKFKPSISADYTTDSPLHIQLANSTARHFTPQPPISFCRFSLYMLFCVST